MKQTFLWEGGNLANRQFCDKKARSFGAKDDLTGVQDP